MDNPTAQNILSAYRPNGADSTDPVFKPALDQCANDPDLRDWLDGERAFDQRMIRSLAEIRPPANGKEEVLSTVSLNMRKPLHMFRWGLWALPLAAMLVIGLFLFSALRPAPVVWEPGEFNLASLVSGLQHLDFQSGSVVELKQFLEDRGAPTPDSLPELLATALGHGCTILEDGKGNQISLMCFKMENQFVHVYVFTEETRHYLDLPEDKWHKEKGWNLRRLEQGGYTLAIATSGRTSFLDPLFRS
ncbi:MAG: hypothetical protein WD708_08180 [Kiritimatiellia bacterium]